jgi:dipeptidyl aminopeptidase/acylaminoacyl peptidase
MLIRTALALALGPLTAAPAQQPPDFPPLANEDVLGLEFAADPQIAPDGARVVYERHFADRLADVMRSNLWIVQADGSGHRPLTSGDRNDGAPRWSPDGTRLAFVSSAEGSSQLYVRWMDSGQTARLAQLAESPGAPVWSPDGRWIAFVMFVEDTEAKPFAELPKAPEGATWAPLPKVITELHYRHDGEGYLQQGKRQLFVIPAEGGAPRALTQGAFDVEGSPSWMPDGQGLVFASNRRADAALEPNDTELWAVSIAGGDLRQITDRRGPDRSPVVSPDGAHVAYVGFDDRYQGYQVSALHVVRSVGGAPRVLTASLDRDVSNLAWSADSKRVLFLYDDRGSTRLGEVDLEGQVRELARDLGGQTLGRPYDAASFSVARTGRVAFTSAADLRPGDVAVLDVGARSSVPLTALNEDLLGARSLGYVDELVCESSFDGRELQGWVVHPPKFDADRRYPLLLEIHGGPFANYGKRFSAEMQLYAAAGYVVLYMNPRGSTSYGEEFGNLIHHAYPGHDYDDLISAVDALIQRGYVDPTSLFVTGGSGGGVLTAWIVGNSDRFKAAVVAKPVINWQSFVLTADETAYFTKYWFASMPWEDPEHYFARSPLSLVGKVKTPTMVLTGEVDYRTPISESEQYYAALKLCGVDSALVRIPEASHGITARPSRLFVQPAYTLAWFEKHK